MFATDIDYVVINTLIAVEQYIIFPRGVDGPKSLK